MRKNGAIIIPKIFLLLSGLAIFISACGGSAVAESKAALKRVTEVKVDELDTLFDKKIYFGHQSVGFNIVDGIKDILNENTDIKLNVVETKNPEDFKLPVFAHSRNGKNTKPESRIDDFVQDISGGIGNNADYAIFKFCFIDVTEKTDVENIFEYYKKSFAKLKKKYPKTTFVHVTVPLTTMQTGLKAIIKKIIGRRPFGYEDNYSRYRFNNMLLDEYRGREPVFDIAEIESTKPDGKRISYEKNGETFNALAPEYALDGGLLNETGRKYAAARLLNFLADLDGKSKK
ncbi:MAG: hypothetical protein IEMM0002_1021 [bacterium]|nr:MAG: hypothetical protein IEMM0002_1021 [bacterium]